jgi:capsular exopolysaccharide synthesis family protein
MTGGPKKRGSNWRAVGTFGAVAYKHRWLTIALSGLVLAGGLTYSIRAPSVYYSRALVRVNRAALGLDTEKLPDEERLRMVMKDLTQPHILERTATRLGIKASSATLKKQYLFKISVHPSAKGDLEVELWPSSKAWAERWTPTLVEEYLDFRSEKRLQEKGGAISAKPSPNLPANLAQVNKRLDDLGRARVSLQDPQLDPAGKLALVASLLVSPQPPWDALEKEQRALQSELAANPDGDRALAINDALAAVAQKLQRELDNALERLDREYQDLIAQRPVSEDVAGLAASPPPGRTGRTVATRDTVGGPQPAALTYAGLLQISDRPVSPNRLQLLLITLGLSLVLGIGAPLLVEFFDRSRHIPQQVEATFLLRRLGTVPEIDDARRQSLGEYFQFIRTNLLSVTAPHVTMVTSAMPKEGKTVVSSNLARSFAQAGSRTLLIDADLRRGRVHRVFGYRKTPGLSAVLRGEISLDQAIRKTPEPNLSVLTCGQSFEASVEFLSSPNFATAFASLRNKFEKIVMDAPPVLGLSDTALLRPHVDGIVFVIRSGHTTLRTVKAALEAIGAAKVVGFVLNRLDLGAPTSFDAHAEHSAPAFGSIKR